MEYVTNNYTTEEIPSSYYPNRSNYTYTTKSKGIYNNEEFKNAQTNYKYN